MQDFRFDDSKSFAENCEAFLETLDSSDPDMAKILCDNWDALVVIVREGERGSKARGEFNVKVASALDVLAKPVGSKDGP